MLRIAIAEDNARDRAKLRGYLERFCQDTGTSIETDVYEDGLHLAERYEPVYDLLLLDIEMPLLDGMQTARRIRERDPAVLILFLTNMHQYAIEGYKVGALDYVLKPVSYFAFSSKLKKICAMLERRSDTYLMLRIDGNMSRINTDEIDYIEVLNHRLSLHTERGEFQITIPLRSMEEKLEGHHFARCNKSFLVNLRHIVTVKPDSVLLSSGDELPLSRLRRKEFLLAVTDYYGGGGK